MRYPNWINNLPQQELDKLAKFELIDSILIYEGWDTPSSRKTKNCQARLKDLEQQSFNYLAKVHLTLQTQNA